MNFNRGRERQKGRERERNRQKGREKERETETDRKKDQTDGRGHILFGDLTFVLLVQ
jgi:hypothetical protein